MARSRRPRRRWTAAPEGCPLAIFHNSGATNENGHSYVKMAGGGGGSDGDINDDVPGDTDAEDAPYCGGRVPVDTAPGPVPVYTALQIPTSAHHHDDELHATSFTTENSLNLHTRT